MSKVIMGKDLTVGSVPKAVIGFTVPRLIGSILTVGYSIIDTIWVGNLLGKEAVGAIAISFPIMMLLNALVLSLSTATSVIARA